MTTIKTNNSRHPTLSGKYDFLLESASLEDLQTNNVGASKENGDIDINDELQLMQDLSCFNLYKKRVKKGRKYKEWKKDEIRDSDAD